MTNDPARPYDPDKVNLATKIQRHLRRKGWKLSRKLEQWIDPTNGLAYSLRRALFIQMDREV